MKTVNVTLAGVGGQGILLTANLLADTAAIAGMDVKKSEIHGMAQRGGSVVSSVRFGTKVFSPIVPEGESDVLVAFDRLEALRWAHVLAADGKALVNDADLVPVTVSTGQQPAVADFDRRLKKALPGALWIDANGVAAELGNARTTNMVIAGALSVLTPFRESQWLKAMEQTFTGRKAALLEINRKAFARGRELAAAGK